MNLFMNIFVQDFIYVMNRKKKFHSFLYISDLTTSTVIIKIIGKNKIKIRLIKSNEHGSSCLSKSLKTRTPANLISGT